MHALRAELANVDEEKKDSLGSEFGEDVPEGTEKNQLAITET